MTENYQTTTDAESCHKLLQAGVLYLIYSVFNNQTMNYIRILFNFREVPIRVARSFLDRKTNQLPKEAKFIDRKPNIAKPPLASPKL